MQPPRRDACSNAGRCTVSTGEVTYLHIDDLRNSSTSSRFDSSVHRGSSFGDSYPDPDWPRHRQILQGEVPSLIDPPSGYFFHPRRPIAKDGLCDVQVPELLPGDDQPDRLAACHLRTSVMTEQNP